MTKSRSEYVLKNVSIALAMQVVKNILAFFSRTVFVYVLGAEYLGVNSLFTDILTVLSFAELGIGNAMVYSLYKPIAENDTFKIRALMNIYERAYKIIGIVIAGLGICVVPFIKFIVGDIADVKENLIGLYLLFLMNSVLSYFFVYKKSLIIADQKNYIVDIYQQIFYAIQVICQSIFLILTKNFFVYLLIMILTTFGNNLYVAKKADRMYPYLREKNSGKLDKSEISSIVTNVKALVIYKIGGIILESTDSIFISSFINVATVGLYANYKIVINVFKTIGFQIMNSIVASVGNLNASEGVSKKESVFYEIFYVSAWFYGFATVGLCFFLTPLIRVWLGEAYVIGGSAVLAACIYFYISNMHYPCYTYRTTAGLFIYGKYVPVLCAVLNIILNIIMGLKWGLSGILWASIVSRILTYEIIDPLLVYKKIFQKSPIKYFIVYFAVLICVISDGIFSYWISNHIILSGLVGFIVRLIVFSILFNTIFLLVTFKTRQFKTIYGRVVNILHRKIKK